MLGNRMRFVPGGFSYQNKLEQLQFKLEKNVGIEKHAGKVKEIKKHSVTRYFSDLSLFE